MRFIEFKVLIISILSSFHLYAATQAPDTLNIIVNADETDTIYSLHEDLIIDSLIFVDNVLYQNDWNSIQIKYPDNLMPSKDALLLLKLVGDQESQFTMPYKGKIISKFGMRNGRMHTGTDIKLNSGDTIVCAFDGRVRMAKAFSGYGNAVVVRHKNGLETIYSHLKKICVQVNDTLKAGDLIGLGGRTGRATCDHLHFETRLLGKAFDSYKYIDFETFTLRSDVLYYKNKQFEIDLANLKVPIPIDQPSVYAQNNPNGIHVIQKGDTLWSIAKTYNTSVTQICANNSITAHTILKIGEVLKVK